MRSQVGDIATFEKHVSNLIEAVPRDGSTVDLSELFFRCMYRTSIASVCEACTELSQ